MIFMSLTLIIMNLLFIGYDNSLCPAVQGIVRNYSEYNSTGEVTFQDIRKTECEIPNWIKMVINAPFLAAIALIGKKYILI